MVNAVQRNPRYIPDNFREHKYWDNPKELDVITEDNYSYGLKRR